MVSLLFLHVYPGREMLQIMQREKRYADLLHMQRTVLA